MRIFDNDLQLIGQSVLLNNSYMNSVSKTEQIAESSLRFPIVECLERRIGASDIQLEYAHPFFKRRLIDIYWCNNHNDKCVFELKFIKPGFRTKHNIQRVFDDVFRLAYASKEGMCSYLLVCGKTDDYKTEFQKINEPSSEEGVLKRKFKDKVAPYDSLLSFDIKKSEKQICFTESETHFSHFCKNYECKPGKKQGKELRITTKLVFINKRQKHQLNVLTHTVSIWEIKYEEQSNAI